MKTKLPAWLYVAALILFTCFQACNEDNRKHNVLTDKETEDGWVLLFDGQSLNGWHIFNKGKMPAAWSADSGALVCNPHAGNVKHGDLVTDNDYENYDLRFDWKISKGGNSGVFIDVKERKEFGSTFSTGPEYQLLDEKNAGAEYLKNPSHRAAAIFGVIPNTSRSETYAGKWNTSRILQKNGRVTFWLNGVETVNVDLKSDAWKNTVAASSMNRYPSFGAAIQGHLALQDWTSGVAFRDIKIREL